MDNSITKVIYKSKFKWWKLGLGAVVLPGFFLFLFLILKVVIDEFSKKHKAESIVFLSFLFLIIILLLIIIYSITFSIFRHLLVFNISEEGIEVRNIFSENPYFYSWDQFIGYSLTLAQGEQRVLVLFHKNKKKTLLYENWYWDFDLLCIIIENNIQQKFKEEIDLNWVLMGFKSLSDPDK